MPLGVWLVAHSVIRLKSPEARKWTVSLNEALCPVAGAWVTFGRRRERLVTLKIWLMTGESSSTPRDVRSSARLSDEWPMTTRMTLIGSANSLAFTSVSVWRLHDWISFDSL